MLITKRLNQVIYRHVLFPTEVYLLLGWKHRRETAHKLTKTRLGPSHIREAGGDLWSIFVLKHLEFSMSIPTLHWVSTSASCILTVCSPLQRRSFYKNTLSITLKAVFHTNLKYFCWSNHWDDSRSLWVTWSSCLCNLQTDTPPTVACGFNSSGNAEMRVGEGNPQEKDVVNTLQMAHHTAILWDRLWLPSDLERRNQSTPNSIPIRRIGIFQGQKKNKMIRFSFVHSKTNCDQGKRNPLNLWINLSWTPKIELNCFWESLCATQHDAPGTDVWTSTLQTFSFNIMVSGF